MLSVRMLLALVSLMTSLCVSINSFAQADAASSGPAIAVNVVNPEDLLDYSRTLVVPTAYVSLLTEGSVSAVKQSGMFQSGNAIR